MNTATPLPRQAKNFLNHNEPISDWEDRFKFRYMGISYERAEKMYSYGPHLHNNHEIIFVDQGTYRGSLDAGAEVEVKPRQIMIVGPGQIHRDRCEQGLAYYTLWFRLWSKDVRGKKKQISLLSASEQSDVNIFTLDQSLIWPSLQKMIALGENNYRFALPLLQTCAEQLFWQLAEILPQNRLSPEILLEGKVTQLQYDLDQLFKTHLQLPLSVKNMAQHLRMSESSLAHQCQDQLGISPAKALMRYRLETAAHWILQGEMKLKNISFACGFCDTSHFANVFKKYFGKTPKEFREEEQI